MSIIYFFMLFGVLTADGLMIFLTPVLVYQLTGSIEYSGLSYALWWLPRCMIIPLIGKYIDYLGIRPLSIISDAIKSAGCMFLAFSHFSSDLEIAVAFGIVGSLISIGNSQTIISYEKIVSLISKYKDHHVNLISRMDFSGMVVGPLIGMILIDYSIRVILIVPCVLYIVNAIFFFSRKKGLNTNHEHNVNDKEHSPVIFTDYKQGFKLIILAPALILSVFLASGNNLFDGLVESTGAALIDRNMGLPVKYFGMIDVVAGVFGVAGTYLYGMISVHYNRNNLLAGAVLVITGSSIMLIAYPSSFPIFVGAYALSIVGKVFTGNICRMIRIEKIPVASFAGTSSIIVLLNQSVLPLIGLIIYFSGDSTELISLFMIIAVLITFLSGVLLWRHLNTSEG